LYDLWNHPDKRPAAGLGGNSDTERLLLRIRGLEKQLQLPPAELPANPGAPQWSGAYHDPAVGYLSAPPGGFPRGKSPWGL
jgi:hypothetical protein